MQQHAHICVLEIQAPNKAHHCWSNWKLLFFLIVCVHILLAFGFFLSAVSWLIGIIERFIQSRISHHHIIIQPIFSSLPNEFCGFQMQFRRSPTSGFKTTEERKKTVPSQKRIRIQSTCMTVDVAGISSETVEIQLQNKKVILDYTAINGCWRLAHHRTCVCYFRLL